MALVLGVLLARLMQDDQTGTAVWDAERAAGFIAYALLWLSVVTGMALFLRIRPGGGPLTGMLEIHRVSSALGIAFTAAHVAGLLADPVVHFSLIDVVVPLASDYRPLQVGLGTLAMELALIVLLSTAGAAWIPYQVWRKLHYVSFPCWLLALIHGVTAGSDSAAPAVMTLYAGTAGVVAAMASVRLYGRSWARGY